METLSFKPLTSKNWKDFELLFGARGACGGCWCMHWRLSRSEFEQQKGEQNRKAMKKLVDSDDITGIIAYYKKQPVGWCAVGPRSAYKFLAGSRILKPVDEKPVWSITCLFISRSFRRKGVSVELLKTAVSFVRDRGGAIVEGYPIEPRNDRMPDVFMWTGLASAFRHAGFTEVTRRSETRPIMRYVIAAD